MRDAHSGLAPFVRELYFELQTIEGVKPLEIWSGFHDAEDSFEKASLIKNLYKIVIPLVNERCFGRPFAEHSRAAYETVAAVVAWFAADLDATLFERFPWPPTGDADQKDLYRMVKARAAMALGDVVPPGEHDERPEPPAGAPQGFASPDSLFDFREMRIVDNELPYIIFTDKEFRVIHGIAIVYLWLIDLEEIVLRTFTDAGVEQDIRDEYRALSRKVHKEDPFTAQGKRADPANLMAYIQERLRGEDYLDLFESVYRWFEQTREKNLGQ